MKNGLIVDDYGTKCYYLNDLLHRVDGPAVEYANGDKVWYLHDEFHRVDGPAIEHIDGSKFWFLHGKRHRVDCPAVEWADGEKFWYVNGEQLVRPKEFQTMEEFIEKTNTDEEYSLPWINNINGIIEFIKNPSPKQKRLHAMKWKI